MKIITLQIFSEDELLASYDLEIDRRYSVRTIYHYILNIPICNEKFPYLHRFNDLIDCCDGKPYEMIKDMSLNIKFLKTKYPEKIILNICPIRQ